MGNAGRKAVAGAVLLLGTALVGSVGAPRAGAQEECAIDGGPGVCDAIRTEGAFEPGNTVSITATSDSCGNLGSGGSPAEVLYFTDGMLDGEPVGEGVLIATTSPPAVLEEEFTIPEDEEGAMAFAMRCLANGTYTASNPGVVDVTSATADEATSTTAPTAATEDEVVALPVGLPEEHPRPSISTSVPSIGDVSTDAGLVVANLVIAVLLLLVAFPAELFNATFEEHYDEIAGWFKAPARTLERLSGAGEGSGPPWLPFAGITAIAAVLYGFLDPNVAFDQATIAMVLGIGLSIAVAVLVSGAVARRYVSSHHSDPGRLRIYPGAVFVAVACVLVSRLVEFQPGYLYGVVAGFVFTVEMSREDDGRNAARVAIAGLGLSVACWLLLSPVRELMDDPQPGFVLVLLEAFLAAMFVGGLHAVVFGFLPLRYLPGQKVWQWSKPVWLALFGIGLFGFLQVLLHPASDYEGSMVTMIVLFLAFGAVSVGFWAYFRNREVVGAPSGSEGGLDDLEVAAEDRDDVEAQ